MSILSVSDFNLAPVDHRALLFWPFIYKNGNIIVDPSKK